MASDSRIGLIGLDTSHVTIFSKILNDPNDPHHVPGGKVVVGHHPGGSEDFALSHTRSGKFTAELKDSFGVKIVDSIEAVAEASDLVFIESVDGRVHRQQFDRVLPFGKPIFIDKPMALNTADAVYMFDAAKKAGVPLMSASSLRYFDVAVEAIGDGQRIIGCDAFGPMGEEPTQPGLFWYGIHTVEMIVAAMGVGCSEVRVVRNENNDLLSMIWRDGRTASLHGVRKAHSNFGLIVHRADGVCIADPGKSKKPYYAGLVEAIMRALPSGISAIPSEQTVEIIRIIEAANQSRVTGQPVRLHSRAALGSEN